MTISLTKIPARLTGPERFFYEHAGWSYDPATETSEIGRVRCARQLAAAERIASERDYVCEWVNDSDAEPYGNDPAGECWPQYGAILRDKDAAVLGSLWGIGFRDRQP